MIYIFGDSFSTPNPNPNINWAWPNALPKALESDVVNVSVAASGLEYTFGQFEKYRKKFKSKDIIIITLTAESRTYFFPDRPRVSKIDSENISREEKLAVEYFMKYLENLDNIRVNTLNFLHAVKDISLEKDLHTIVLHGFNNSHYNDTQDPTRFHGIHVSQGNMFNYICQAECANDFIYQQVMGPNGDIRFNHMCKANHIILTNKLISNIRHNTPIDLRQGFELNIIDDAMLFQLNNTNCSNW